MLIWVEGGAVNMGYIMFVWSTNKHIVLSIGNDIFGLYLVQTAPVYTTACVSGHLNLAASCF